jgi:hypothetical protein
MAKFITNSAGIKAIRIEDIVCLSIDQASTATGQGVVQPGDFVLSIKTSLEERFSIPFESASTLEAVQALAAPIMAALEA